MGKYDAQIAAGMALLDEHAPGWETRIDVETLDLWSTCNCILGQEFGRFEHGLCLLILDGPAATRYGFDVDPRASDALHIGYRTLTSEWRRAIRARLAAPPVASGAGEEAG